jgi:hypothetical protein
LLIVIVLVLQLASKIIVAKMKILFIKDIDFNKGSSSLRKNSQKMF